MTGVNNCPSWTQSGAVADVVSTEPCHIVLETSPPDYVEKISRYLESSVGQSGQNKVSNEAAEAGSDSGDSLFITQKPAPRPVRSGRRRRCSLKPHPTSPRGLEESEDDASSSASHGESRTDKRKKGRKKYRLPKYSFPFLTERSWKPRGTLLPAPQNISLHNCVMGGFFNCVREVWQGYQRGDDESSLPTVDMNGDISPLSEAEEERPVDEDIKVVERKRFVAPSKAKRQQTWCSQLKQETSGKSQRKTLRTMPAEESMSRDTPLPLDTEIFDNGQSSCRALVERERNDAQVTSERHFLAQTETPSAKRRLSRGSRRVLYQQKAREEEEEEEERSPRQHTQRGRKASPTVTEPQSDVFSQTGPAEDEPESRHLLHRPPDLMSDINSAHVCDEAKLKKKKDKGDHVSVEQGRDQSREEPEGLRAAASVNVEVEEAPSLSRDNRAEPLAWQTGDQLDCNGKNWIVNSSHDDNGLRREERDTPDSKRSKSKTPAENGGQEVNGNLQSDAGMEDSVSSVRCNAEKKKRKRSGEGAELLQPSTVAKPRSDDDGERKKNKKKRKKEKRPDEREEEEVWNRTADLPPVSTGQLEESGNCLENTADSQETLEFSDVKRKKHKKKRALASNDGEEEPATQSTEMSLKKKKVDICSNTEDNEKVGNTELVTKKKKKKTSAICSRNISEDTAAQSDDSVSVQEKEKRRTSSSLAADAEESDAQAHGQQQHSPSRSVDARVSAAGDRETESAEIAGNSEGSDHGFRKKKKKRKRRTSVDGVEKDQEQEFEEPSETCLGEMRLKGNESESATPMERLESAEDAVVVQRKKKGKDRTCRVIRESPLTTAGDIDSERSTLNSRGSDSRRKKGKRSTLPGVAEGPHGLRAGRSHDGSTNETMNMVEHASPSSEAPGNQALNETRTNKKEKKAKSTDKVLLEGKSLTKSAELEKKARGRSSSPASSQTSLPNPDMSHPDKLRKVKRRLHNPTEDFLTDC